MRGNSHLAVSSIAGFSAYASTGMFFPIIAVYALSIGADRFMAGFIAGAQTLVTALSMILFGLASDIVGRRKLIIAGLTLYAAAPLLYILADTPLKLLAARLIHGLAPSTFIPSATAYVVDKSENLGKGYVIGAFTTSTQMGYALGPLIGGAIYQIMGFTNLLLVSAALPLAGLVLFIAKTGGQGPSGGGKGGGGASGSGGGVGLHDAHMGNRGGSDPAGGYGVYIVAVATLVFSTLTAAGVGLYIVPILVETLDLAGASAVTGLILFGLFLSSSLVRIPAGYISDRVGRTPLILAGLMIQLAGLATIYLGRSLPAVAAGSIMVGGGMGISNTMSIALISEKAPAARRGIGMGAGGTSIQLGVAIGPSLAGYLYTYLDIDLTLQIFIAIIAVYLISITIPLLYRAR